MTIVPVDMINCTCTLHRGRIMTRIVTTNRCICVWFLRRTTVFYNIHIFEHRKHCNSATIGAGDNQGNASIRSQLVHAFISACRYNDTHLRDHANTVELQWEFTVCQGEPRHLLQLAEKISSAFFWATRHRVTSTHWHGTT
jgi:hypothetical protein